MNNSYYVIVENYIDNHIFYSSYGHEYRDLLNSAQPP